MTEPVINEILDTINERVRGARLIDWIHNSPGIIVDEATALATSCKAFDIGEGKKMYFSSGIIGAMDPDQVEKYCKGITEEESPALKERVSKFRKASDICVSECEILPKGERLECRLTCMSKELKKHGIVC
jgi:hypothetical protein